MVLVRIWNFIKRHRRKIALFGIAAGGFYVAYRYARNYFLESETKEIAIRMLERNKQQYFDSMVRNANTTTRAMLSQTSDEINFLVDTDSLTSKLKQGGPVPSRAPGMTGSSVTPPLPPDLQMNSQTRNYPSNEDNVTSQSPIQTKRIDKLGIWRELKVLGFSKALSSLYSVCYLTVCVRIQLSLLSGYLFLSATPPELLRHLHSDCETPEQSVASHSKTFVHLSPNVKTKYLQSLESAFKVLLRQLTECMQEKCHETVDRISLKERLTLRKLDSLIHEIRLNFERELNSLRPRLVVPDQLSTIPSTSLHSDQLNDCEQLGHLLTETEELFSSSEFTGVLKACSDGLFAHFLEYLANHFDCQYHEEQKTSQHTTSLIINGHSSNTPPKYATQTGDQMCVYDISLPLAKLVPVLISVSDVVFRTDQQNNFIDSLLQNDILNSFSYNIYQTFCENQAINMA